MALFNREKMKNRDNDDSPPMTPAAYSGQNRTRQTAYMPRNMPKIVSWLGLFAMAYLYFRYASHSIMPCKCSVFQDSESLTPAADAVEYTITRLYPSDTHASPYQGWPTDAKDEMWQEMYEKGLGVAIDDAAHRKLMYKSEHAPSHGHENEYLISLGVFQQLECLNLLRQALYPTRYNSSVITSDGKVNFFAWNKLDTCIESLRQALTCSADVTAIPFEWLDTKILKPQPPSTRMCRNFAKIQKWAFDRSVELQSKRSHVENGIVVDYGHYKTDPDAVSAAYTPYGWDKTAQDL